MFSSGSRRRDPRWLSRRLSPTVRIGTWVCASPLRMPWGMAWEAHSLSVLTEGRFEMGIGTGRPGIEDELRQVGHSSGDAGRERLAHLGVGVGHARVGVTSTSPVGERLELDRPEPRYRVLSGYFAPPLL